MSVVLATPESFATIRRTVEHLARQSVHDALELVVVVPSLVSFDADATLLRAFARVEVVEVGTVGSIGSANAAGVVRASAPVVALGEDHAFADPGWAAALIAAHEGSWAAVGPSVRNANPATAVSRADLWIGYGPWIAPGVPGEHAYLPGHNTSYKRDALVAYGERLPAMLDAETLLHWDLRAHGHRLWFEPRAVIAHANFSLWRSWLPAQFHYGRVFAGMRALDMSVARRVVYTVGGPLIPPLRLARLWRDARARSATRSIVGCLHALVAGLAMDGLGQMAGYAFGVGRAGERVSTYEFRRYRHVRPDERPGLWPA
jgi:GT2 family glycosyltransferase